jgi:hypothetical protein
MTLSADERKYGIYKKETEEYGKEAVERIVSSLGRYAAIQRLPHPPCLRIAGKEKEPPPKPKNVIDLGIPPRMTEIVVPIGCELFFDLTEEAGKQGLGSTKELVQKVVDECVDYENQPPSAGYTAMMEAIFGKAKMFRVVK